MIVIQELPPHFLAFYCLAMSITGPSRVHDDIIVVAAEMTMMSNSLLVIVRPRIDSMVIAHWYHTTLSMHITIVHCTNTRDLLNATIQSHQ